LSDAIGISLVDERVDVTEARFEPFLPVQFRRDPTEKARANFSAIDLVQHLVSSARIEIMGDVVNARFTKALDQGLDSE
jgi:hypothetical protein